MDGMVKNLALNDNEKLMANDIMQKTGLTESRFEFSINQLQNLNLVMKENTGSKAKYRLSNKYLYSGKKNDGYSAATKILRPDKDYEQIVEAANMNDGVISKEEISTLLGITPAQAYTLITQYITEGKMTLVQSGRYSKYQII